jgi:hypothetical protein
MRHVFHFCEVGLNEINKTTLFCLLDKDFNIDEQRSAMLRRPHSYHTTCRDGVASVDLDHHQWTCHFFRYTNFGVVTVENLMLGLTLGSYT